MKKLVMTFLLLIASPVAFADTIAIIGTGQVAGGLGPEFASQGHDVIYGSREPDSEKTQALVAKTPGNASAQLPPDSVRDADIVVLAVPGLLVEDCLLYTSDAADE